MTTRAEAIEAAAQDLLGYDDPWATVPPNLDDLRRALSLSEVDPYAAMKSERDTLLQMRDEYLRQIDRLHSRINYLRGQYLGKAAEARRTAARAWFGRRWFILAAESLEDTAQHLADALDDRAPR